MAAAEVTAPLVLQCGLPRCRLIIGDSLSLVGMEQELNLFAIGTANNVNVDGQMLYSQSGRDQGSAYQVITCNECKTVLGRKYQTTPAGLDHLRDAYAFDITKIVSYQLGQTEDSLQKMPMTNVEAVEQQAAELRAELSAAQETIERMQEMLLLHGEHIMHLELLNSVPADRRVLQAPPPPAPLAPVERPKKSKKRAR